MKLLVGLSVLATCGRSKAVDPHADSCGAETRADTFVVGLDKHGASGAFDFALTSAKPAPPARGDNTWILELHALASGSAIAGAAITVTPFMPDHGHGTPIKARVTPLPTAGQYEVSPVNLWMPGYWETTISASQGAIHDSSVFRFCIPN